MISKQSVKKHTSDKTNQHSEKKFVISILKI